MNRRSFLKGILATPVVAALTFMLPEPLRPRVAAWINARDYGAWGDGKHDDTDAIRYAVRAAMDAGGGTVFLPAGVYRYNGPFPGELVRGVTLQGAGKDRTTIRG